MGNTAENFGAYEHYKANRSRKNCCLEPHRYLKGQFSIGIRPGRAAIGNDMNLKKKFTSTNTTKRTGPSRTDSNGAPYFVVALTEIQSSLQDTNMSLENKNTIQLQSINQSMDRTINQSTDQCTEQSINQSINQSSTIDSRNCGPG